MTDEKLEKILADRFIQSDKILLSLLRQVANETRQEIVDSMNTTNLRKSLAEEAHFNWSRWMKCMLSQSTKNYDGTLTISKLVAEKWTKQAHSTYLDSDENLKLYNLADAGRLLLIVKLLITKS